MNENHINLISENTKIRGEFQVTESTRFHGEIQGNLTAAKGAVLTLGSTASVYGDVSADELFIDGYVKGTIRANQKVSISSQGRVIGDIHAPQVEIQTGAFFEGRCETGEPLQ